MQISIYFFLHFVTSIFLFYIFFDTLKRLELAVAKELTFVILCSCISLFGTSLSMLLVNPQAKFFWHEFKFLGIAFMPVMTIIMLLRFFKKDHLITKRNIFLLCIVPAITVILAWTNSFHHLFRSRLFLETYNGNTFVATEPGIWFWVHSTYSYVVLTVGMLLLFTEYLRIPIIFRTQTRIMLFGAATGTAVNVIGVMGLFNDYGDLSVAAMSCCSICNYIALCRYKPKKMIELARNLAINNIKSCVFIFDLDEILLDANTYAKEEFNIDSPDIGKLSFDGFVKNTLNINDKTSLDSLEVSINRNEARYYRVTDTPLYDSKSKYVGRVLVLNNITNVKQKVNDFQHIVTHDFLTDLYNSQEFMRQVKILNESDALPISIVYFNIDKMRIINSIFSFDFGDKVIKAVANAIATAAKPNDLCFRVNGDEFALLLPSADAIQARRITDKILEIYQNNTDIDVSVTVSHYIGTKHDKTENLETILNDTIQGTGNNKAVSAKTSNDEIYNALNNYFIKNGYKTDGHVERLRNLCSSLAARLDLDKEQTDNLHLLCSVYDIGIISTSKQIIKKMGSLSNDEWEEMKLHTIKGYSIARLSTDINKISNEILSHHERYDGYGYPNRLSGNDIPLLSRILYMVEYYDSLIYKKAMSASDALKIIKKYSGSRFDPSLVDEFGKIVDTDKTEPDIMQDFMAFIQSQLN